MGKTYRRWKPDQSWLLPPSPRDWMPEGHLVYFLLDVVEQIDLWALPTRPTKKTDSRSKGFDDESVEVDAIPPGQLRRLVRNCILQHIDRRQMLACEKVEQAERATLQRIIGNLGADSEVLA